MDPSNPDPDPKFTAEDLREKAAWFESLVRQGYGDFGETPAMFRAGADAMEREILLENILHAYTKSSGRVAMPKLIDALHAALAAREGKKEEEEA